MGDHYLLPGARTTRRAGARTEKKRAGRGKEKKLQRDTCGNARAGRGGVRGAGTRGGGQGGAGKVRAN